MSIDLTAVHEKKLARRGKNGVAAHSLADERRLVQDCLAGDERAWSELFKRRQPRLLRAIRLLSGPDGNDPSFVDEIASRVWHVLLRNGKEVLLRYDPDRDSHLGAFLMGIAKLEIMQYRRSERRRRRRECVAGRWVLARQRLSRPELSIMLDEFLSGLTRHEREFLEEFLLTRNSDGNGAETTPASSVWQQRSRLLAKMNEFLENT